MEKGMIELQMQLISQDPGWKQPNEAQSLTRCQETEPVGLKPHHPPSHPPKRCAFLLKVAKTNGVTMFLLCRERNAADAVWSRGDSLVVIIHIVLLCTTARPAPRLASSARAPLKRRRTARRGQGQTTAGDNWDTSSGGIDPKRGGINEDR